MEDIKINLTDQEWMSLIDQTDEGLEYCCANISALRDDIILAARYGRSVSMWQVSSLVRHWYWFWNEGHGPSNTLIKFMNQVLENDEARKIYLALKEIDGHEKEKEAI